MNSINLLPPEIKNGLEQKKKNLVVRRILVRSIWAFIFTVLFSGAAWFYLNYSAGNIDDEMVQKEEAISKFGLLENKAKKAADKISSVKKIESKLNHWENVVAEVQKVMPAGTYLSRVSLNADGKVRASMTGFAKSKENIASLRDALENSEYFQYVDIDNAATQTDPRNDTEVETFTISFSFEKGALDD